jgi:hypothetical protein
MTVVNAAAITAVTPAHAAGVVDVAVTTPGGTGTGSGLYTYGVPGRHVDRAHRRPDAGRLVHLCVAVGDADRINADPVPQLWRLRPACQGALRRRHAVCAAVVTDDRRLNFPWWHRPNA